MAGEVVQSAFGGEVRFVGLTLREGGDVVQVTVAGGALAGGEPAVQVAGADEIGDGGTGAVVAPSEGGDVAGGRVAGPALPYRVGGELADQGGGQGPVAEELAGFVRAGQDGACGGDE